MSSEQPSRAAETCPDPDDRLHARPGAAVLEVEPGFRVLRLQPVVPDQRGAEGRLGPADPEDPLPVEPGDRAGAAGTEHAVAVHDRDWPAVVEARDGRVVPIRVERSRAKFGHVAPKTENAE